MRLTRRLKALGWVAVDQLVFVVSAAASGLMLERMPQAGGFAILALMDMVRVWVFVRGGLYRSMLRYSSTDTLVWLSVGVVAGSIVATAAGFFAFMQDIGGLGRVFLVLEGLLTLALCGGLRFAVRCASEAAGRSHGEPTLVYGAGPRGERVLRVLRQDPGYRPVGLLDDRAENRGALIHGCPVVGSVADLPALVACRPIRLLVLAQDLTPAELRRLFQVCMDLGIRLKRGGIDGVEAGTCRIEDLALEDLLRRPVRSFDDTALRRLLAGRRVMVTGAGGSIGSDLCRQAAAYGAAALALVDSSEAALYQIDLALRERFPQLPVSCHLIDCCVQGFVAEALERARPHIIFHAAAYKHVPMVEANPLVGMANNVGGFANLLAESTRVGVERLVLISSDKAVRPTSVMGASKRVCELLLQSWNVAGGNGCAVRFGNVLGSSGSVVPLFLRQIARGGPVTVTHPGMTRFFMLIPEAVELVLLASALSTGGELFLLDMGEPVKIDHLARQLIFMTGLIPDRDIPVVYTGLRPGEKLAEELLLDERDAGTAVPGIFRAQVSPHDQAAVATGVAALLAACRERDRAAFAAAVRALVPEWRPGPEWTA